MKHFIVEITYTVPVEQIDDRVSEHRAFLQTGFDHGWLLFSGPQVPRLGGIAVARAPSLADLQAFFQSDPYHLKSLAQYRFIEFEPVKNQPFLADWL